MRSLIIKKNNIYLGGLALCSFFSTLSSVRYIRMVTPHITFLCYVAILGSLIPAVIRVFNKRRLLSGEVLFFWLFFAYLIGTTLFGRGPLLAGLVQLAPTICCCSIITGIEKKEDLRCVLKVWCFCCMVFLLIDIFTMFLFPQGLYEGDSSYYNINWFLGFKTERLYYLLPLVVMLLYIQFSQDLKLNVWHYIIFSLVVICSVFSQATAGTITVILYLICIPFMGVYLIKKKNWITKIISHLVSVFSNFYLFAIAYAFVFISVVVAQSNISLINRIASFTNKNTTFSGRMKIWARCVLYIKNHLLFGSGLLDTVQYQMLTLGYNNPHNILFTYIISGGIIGLILITLCIFIDYKSIHKDKSNICLVLGVAVFLILGISSSSLAFCPFFFVLILMGIKRFD